MPANVYECMFLLDTNKVAGDVPQAAAQIKQLLERNHAEVLASRPWDERRLAYPIKGHKKGLYYLTYFKAEGNALKNIEHDLKLAELVLRHLVLHVDPKLVDIMLTLARDEHALALQAVRDPDSSDGATAPSSGPEGAAPAGEEAAAHAGRAVGKKKSSRAVRSTGATLEVLLQKLVSAMLTNVY